jgi:hypothetical protein
LFWTAVRPIDYTPDKLMQSGQNLGRVFNSRSDCVHAMVL